MTPTTMVTADLTIEVALPEPGGTTVQGHLRGSGSSLELWVSDPAVFAGRTDTGLLRGLAKSLAGRRLTVSVSAPAGPLVTLGVPRASWLQRRLTGSRHMRVDGLRGLLPLLRGRFRHEAQSPLPSVTLVPPPTLYPVAPTFRRRPREVTTTHDPSGGGAPRLIGAPGPAPWPGDRQPVFHLRPEVTTIGSDADCDIVLAGLEGLHATVRRNRDDEYVFVHLGRTMVSRVNGEIARERLLRTGTRLQMGKWTVSFYREEYADHGRPYGGRVGGEIGHQRPQPPRPGGGSTLDWSVR